MVKDVKYIYYVKKKLVWVFYNREDRDKDNATGLKEGGGIKIETTVAFPYTRCTLFLRFCILRFRYYTYLTSVQSTSSGPSTTFKSMRVLCGRSGLLSTILLSPFTVEIAESGIAGGNDPVPLFLSFV